MRADTFALIGRWACGLTGAGFVCFAVLMLIVIPYSAGEKDHMSFGACVFGALFILGCFSSGISMIREAIAASTTSRDTKVVGKQSAGLGPAKTPDSGQSL